MASLNHIKHLGGTWTGHNSLWLQPGTPPFESPTSATIGAVAGGKIVTLDYTWTHEGAPQDGRILLAAAAAEGVHMAWCDSFHMDANILDLVGDGSGEVIAATGSWQLPDSEPWGWRIELEPQGADGFQLRICTTFFRAAWVAWKPSRCRETTRDLTSEGQAPDSGGSPSESV